MPKVILVNPSEATFGHSFITPRWLFVIAAATPTELVGDPVLVDEAIRRFDPDLVDAGDIVGIGINSGSCRPGYRVLKQAKSRGATVILGGIHATLFPDEGLTKGAHAVVTGNGDLIWRQVVSDALRGRLQTRYAGGRVPGVELLKARWDLVDPRKYMMASVQTVAGCPENCSFCSVWVTEGRRPRLHRAEHIIQEVRDLYERGFRFIVFADDNFAPATRTRIAREPSPEKRRLFEQIRDERLGLFDEFDRRAPRDIFTLTQLTAEIASDEEYLSAARHKMRLQLALVGVESFSLAGLASANKTWNPAGHDMIRAIRRMQDEGILVLSSIICGLESDTPDTLAALRRFALQSGSAVAQFTIYSPFPGTKDFLEMVRDRQRPAGERPRHVIELLDDQYWLSGRDPVHAIRHPHFTSQELLRENARCWREFYAVRAIAGRLSQSMPKSWSLRGRLAYLVGSVAFARLYGGRGVSADNVRRRTASVLTRVILKVALAVYSVAHPRGRLSLRVSMVRGDGPERAGWR